MIGFVSGRVLYYESGVALVFSNGVGREIHVNNACVEGNEDYWTHEHAPQDAPHELYGFRERSDRDMFRRLLQIKGVGPKVAMRVIASGSVKVRLDIASQPNDIVVVPATLRAVRGVGEKLCNAICEALQ